MARHVWMLCVLCVVSTVVSSCRIKAVLLLVMLSVRVYLIFPLTGARYFITSIPDFQLFRKGL